MQTWRKVFAVILLLVFAPASVLAAMPLQLCLGSDGHRTVESALSGDHHLGNHHSELGGAYQTRHGSDIASASENRPDCRDVLLQAAWQVSSRTMSHWGDDDTTKIFDAVLPVYPQPLVLAVLCESASRAHHKDGFILHDPHLASLATIVLLN